MRELFDWEGYRVKAEGMTTEALFGALRDINATLDAADKIDRVMGTDNGGRYRDEASVYHAELARRRREA